MMFTIIMMMSTIVVMATILVTIVPFLDGCHHIYRDSHYCGDYISRKIEAFMRRNICGGQASNKDKTGECIIVFSKAFFDMIEVIIYKERKSINGK